MEEPPHLDHGYDEDSAYVQEVLWKLIRSRWQIQGKHFRITTVKCPFHWTSIDRRRFQGLLKWGFKLEVYEDGRQVEYLYREESEIKYDSDDSDSDIQDSDSDSTDNDSD
jgi:hypothetical protein